MKDPEKLLIQQTKNVQAARQMRFTHADEISERESDIKKYMKEAIRVEKSGAKVELKKTNEFEICEEFSDAINKNKELKKSFEKLTPGRQRGYLLYFSSAKQSKTRVERIEKYRKHILKGKGLDD